VKFEARENGWMVQDRVGTIRSTGWGASGRAVAAVARTAAKGRKKVGSMLGGERGVAVGK
jgi:hypothetical protein